MPGTWIVFCSKSSYPDPTQLLSWRTIDNGATWSGPDVVDPDTRLDVRTASDGLGNWLLVEEDEDPSAEKFDVDIMLMRSSDDGLTWSPPITVNVDGDNLPSSDTSPDVATNGFGTWVVVWEDGESVVQSGGVTEGTDKILLRRSTDNGATWGDIVTISSGPSDWRPRVAADGDGNWVVAFIRDPVPGVGQVMVARSADDAQTWSDPEVLDPKTADTRIDSENVRLATDKQGTWTAIWRSNNGLGGTIGSDMDIMVSHSLDNGATWTSPAALSNASGRGEPSDADEHHSELVADVSGNWIATWGSSAFNVGTVGDVGGGLRFTRSSNECPTQPAAGCYTPVSSGRARISLVDGKGRDKLIWRWKRGASTDIADFGDPGSTSDYVLCLYDSVATAPLLVHERDVLRATYTCSDVDACWEQRTKGFRYRDAKNRIRTWGSVQLVDLRPGADGKARISFKAKGPTLAPPRLPLKQEGPVTIQLLNLENGKCWEATYSTAKKNTEKRFKAVSD